jgi:predicted transcriptional regulator
MNRILESEVAVSAITITLPDERLAKLKKIAANLGITPEELVRLSVEDLLTRPDQAFQQAVERVLRKNKELYGRLAQCAT